MTDLRPVRLRCEQREDVPCIDTPAPRLSWALASGEQGRRQTAYRIRVGALWDSGKVASGRSIDIPYAGRPLPPGGEFCWTVEVWDETDAPSGPSEPARFRTGPSEWRAEWIGRDRAHDPGMAAPASEDPPDKLLRRLLSCPYLRRPFAVGGGVRRATLYATARGVVELELNGVRVGDAVLAPGWTDYRSRLEYAAHDVSALLRDGENVLGAILGPGWYAGFVGMNPLRRGNHYGEDPALLCELHVEHEDGSVEVIASDARWQATTGPLEYSDLLVGERYDARRELGEWTPVDHHTSRRRSARPRALAAHARDRGPAAGRDQRARAGRARLRPRPEHGRPRPPGGGGRARHGGPAALRRDGRAGRLALCGQPPRRPAGGRVRPAGRRRRGLRAALHLPRLPLRRGERPHQRAGLETITGRVVHSDTPRSGWFECSDELVNQLWRNIDWGQRGNFISVPTDCPQRDERLGWLGDAQVFLPTATLNMDVAAFFTKWGDDVLDAQSPEGAYSDVAPRLVLERDGAPAWADAGVIMPWTPGAATATCASSSATGTRWSAGSTTSSATTRTCSGRRGAATTTATGSPSARTRRATCSPPPTGPTTPSSWPRWRARSAAATAPSTTSGCATAIIAAFNRAYVGDDAFIEGDTQTAYLLALHMDLLPAELRARAAERLVENIERHDVHLTTGFVGVGLLCPVLSEMGYSEVAHRLLLNETFPSWGYSIRHGATTIWERWDGWTDTDGFQTPEMNSFNHYSLGSVGQWLYEYVGGHPRDGAGLRARPDRARAGRARVGAGHLSLGARRDHERVAARG